MAYIFVNVNRSVGTINPNIYGQFSEHLGRCIYQGIYVGQASDIPNTNGMRNDVVSALKALHVPVLRWPGGCFADTYHWRDGIGPKENRKTIVNTNWGGVTEDNSFGTHEFMELCRQIGCEAYFSGNVGSGTVQEFSDWVEYCNMGGISPMASERRANGQDEPFNVKYWGIGNEAWGCGGSMRAEYYADLCRQYSTYLRNYSPEHKIFKIASGANVADYHWTKTVMERAGQAVDAVSLHYYTVPHEDWQHKGSATDFTDEEYYTTLHKTLQMEELVENHTRIIKQYQGDRKVGLAVDEWGTWYDVEPDTNPGFLYQQNTMRDALVAAINLNIFNNHCDTVCMANIAQMVNVLQAMILTEGSKMVLTPTYHVFEMYKGHQGAKQLESYAETTLLNHDDQAVPDLHVSASQQADGSILVTAANLNDTAAIPVTCMLGGAKPTGVTARVLAGAPAAGDGGGDIHLAQQVCGVQGLADNELQGLQAEVVVDVTAVDGDGTSAVGEQMHPGHGGLPAAGAVMVRLLALIHGLTPPYSAAHSSGFCAAWMCSGPRKIFRRVRESLVMMFRGIMPRTASFMASSGLSCMSLRYLVSFRPPT